MDLVATEFECHHLQYGSPNYYAVKQEIFKRETLLAGVQTFRGRGASVWFLANWHAATEDVLKEMHFL